MVLDLPCLCLIYPVAVIDLPFGHVVVLDLAFCSWWLRYGGFGSTYVVALDLPVADLDLPVVAP